MPQIKSRPCFLTPGSLNPDKPLFVFLPGMDGTGQLLRSQTQDLTTAFDVRCLAIPADDLTDWDDLTEQVLSLIETELNSHSRRSVYLCGESFGGCLALKVALRLPDQFQQIILSNPATSLSHRSWLLWGVQWTDWLPDWFYELSAFGFLPFLASLERTSASDRHALLKAMQSVPAKTVHWRWSMLRNFYINEQELKRLTQPVLILASGGDRLWPSLDEAEHLVRYLPNAKRVVLPDSGHACLLETEINLLEILKHQGLSEAQSNPAPNLNGNYWG